MGVPMISGLWIGALKLGSIWLGLPFFLCALFYEFAGLALWNLRLPGEEPDRTVNCESEVRDVVDSYGAGWDVRRCFHETT
jgi:hypothetical protein